MGYNWLEWLGIGLIALLLGALIVQLWAFCSALVDEWGEYKKTKKSVLNITRLLGYMPEVPQYCYGRPGNVFNWQITVQEEQLSEIANLKKRLDALEAANKPKSKGDK